MSINKAPQRGKATKKNPQNNGSRGAAKSKTKARTKETIYSVMKGRLEVLMPVGKTTVPRRVIAAAVKEVVAKMKP
jgi:hypothetical protein